MLKRIAAISLLLLMLFCAGCTGESSSQQGGAAEATDRADSTAAAGKTQQAEKTGQAESTQPDDGAQQTDGKSYLRDYRFAMIAETDTVLYRRFDDVLYFTDKEYRDWMPLCPRPDCSHDNENCDAWIGGSAGPWVYGDHLYFLGDLYVTDENAVRRYTEAELWRMRFDGTAHEMVCKLPIPEAKAFTAFDNAWSCSWQGKYLIVYYTAYKDTNHEISELYSYVMDLDTLDTVPLTYIDLPYEPETAFSPVYGSGDELYVVGVHFPEDIPEDERTLADRIFMLEKINCTSGEVWHVGTLEKHLYWSEGQISFVDGKLTYMTWDGGDVMDFWQMDLKTGENSHKASYSSAEPHPHRYDPVTGLWFHAFINKSPDQLEATKPYWGLYFYNNDFELVDSALFADMPEEDYENIIETMVSFQSRDYIFGNGPVTFVDELGNEYTGYPFGGTLPEWYIDKADIGTGELRWKRWEP